NPPRNVPAAPLPPLRAISCPISPPSHPCERARNAGLKRAAAYIAAACNEQAIERYRNEGLDQSDVNAASSGKPTCCEEGFGRAGSATVRKSKGASTRPGAPASSIVLRHPRCSLPHPPTRSASMAPVGAPSAK